VLPKFGLMASDDTLEASTKRKETSTEQLEESLGGQQVVASVEVYLLQDVASNHETQSGGSEDSEGDFNTTTRLKFTTVAALASVTYYFGQSTMMKTHLGSLGEHDHYFPKGYSCPLGAESMPEARLDKAVMFEDFFTARLRIPPHPVLLDILHKFRVQLHHLTSNAIVQISKFIWAVTSYGGHPIVDVFAQHYELHY
jgi:hypothetical protein